ncbi:acetyltransferase [Coniochaeta sp. 2T2.1]|nr:acetyltransferase [Coniochaeta sp. 2T2.1]
MATSTITELDLSTCHPNSLANRINAVPGLKSSAAFFTFLRGNLLLPPSAMSSNVSTPYLEPTPSYSLSPPSPSPLANVIRPSSSSSSSSSSHPRSSTRAATTIASDDDIPPLTLDILTTTPEKTSALKLVADSIAQQRQLASRALVFHPLCLTVLAGLLAGAYQIAWVRGDRRDLGTLVTLCSGAVMSYLMAVRYAASGYIRLAEGVGYDFLRTEDGVGEEDLVLGSKYGGEVVGALVLRLEPAAHHSSGNNSKKKSRAAALKGGKGVIRAWTTRMRYRGKGLGGDLLREAVRITKERCGRDAEVGFAREHANSGMVLPGMFNGVFRKGEVRAARALEAVLAEVEGGRRKR